MISEYKKRRLRTHVELYFKTTDKPWLVLHHDYAIMKRTTTEGEALVWAERYAESNRGVPFYVVDGTDEIAMEKVRAKRFDRLLDEALDIR